jgi:hypothetical protein
MAQTLLKKRTFGLCPSIFLVTAFPQMANQSAKGLSLMIQEKKSFSIRRTSIRRPSLPALKSTLNFLTLCGGSDTSIKTLSGLFPSAPRITDFPIAPETRLKRSFSLTDYIKQKD